MQTAKARASSEKERYRRIREVRLCARALQDTVMRSAREWCYVLVPCTLQNAAVGNWLTQMVALLRHMLDMSLCIEYHCPCRISQNCKLILCTETECPPGHTGSSCSVSIRCQVQDEMQREAQSIVAERRGPEISALRTEDGRDGVFAWAGGQPKAGQQAMLAYNKACGAIRCFSNSNLHPADLLTSHPSAEAWSGHQKLCIGKGGPVLPRRHSAAVPNVSSVSALGTAAELPTQIPNRFSRWKHMPASFSELLEDLCRHARDVVLHISHDAWVESEKQDIHMRQLSEKEVC